MRCRPSRPSLLRAARAPSVLSAGVPATVSPAASPLRSIAMKAVLAVAGTIVASSVHADAGSMPPAAKTAAAKAAPSAKAAWRALSPEACTPLADADRAKLPASWAKYLDAARRCELAAPGDTPRVALISVFAETYYATRAADAPWEDFPKPMLVDREFRCVGGLPELFPFDQPRTLTLRHGLWRDGVPQEIRVQVSNPAVGGDYALPALRWDAAEHRYRAAGAKASADFPCPTS